MADARITIELSRDDWIALPASACYGSDARVSHRWACCRKRKSPCRATEIAIAYRQHQGRSAQNGDTQSARSARRNR